MSHDTIALMRRHRSIRRFAEADVPDADVRAAVQAGQAASTSSAVQAYSILRVRDADTRAALVPLTGGQEKVAAAGAFFVICGDSRRHRLVCAPRGRAYDARFEAFLVATVDATLFAQNLSLAFEAMGYGICYIGGLRNDLPEVDRLLDLPEGVYPLYGLCVGVPAETPDPRPRLPVDAVLFDDRYPDDTALLDAVDAYDEGYRAYLAGRGATPRAWSEAMTGLFSPSRRESVGSYYRAKGADMT